MRWLKLVFAVVFVSGCSSLPTKTIQDDVLSYDSIEISQINHWQIKGKLGFKSTTQGGSATINWQQHKANYTITLSGPFSSGKAIISGNQQIAEMQSGSKIVRNTPQQLVMQLTGLPLPVDFLSSWVKGLPSKDRQSLQNFVANKNGSAASFQQHNWQLSFSNYRFTQQGYLPKKIIGQQGEQSFKLLISQWMFTDN
tara:strand:+ start:13148 stop:13738 length:591 start_codon:yes stop_codon:yes gene_type:complete